MKKLFTKHYQSQLLKTKKIKINNKIYIGFHLNDLLIIKLKKDYLKNDYDFTLKGLTYINKNKLQNSILNIIKNDN